MSCCQNANAQNKILGIENFHLFNPNDYDKEDQTYTIDGKAYYAPPWPAERTKYDMGLQGQFSTVGIPDFLNYTSLVNPVQPVKPVPVPVTVLQSGKSLMLAPAMQKINRKSIFTGRYDSYSY